MLKKLLLIILFFIFYTFLIISCSKDDEQGSVAELKISSFEIVNNEKNGVVTRTKVIPKILPEYNIIDHGVIWSDKNALVDKLQLGTLKKNLFEGILYNGLIKGKTYFAYPYLTTQFGTIYGDTLSFKSNVEIDVLITDLSPSNGFIKDTIIVKGKNFCKSSFNSPSSFLLDESYHDVVFISDSLIKVVINPYLNASELKPSLKSCGIVTDIDRVFSIDPPILDSISRDNLYVGEELVIHGKNIHSSISKVWLEGIELKLIDTESVNELKAFIPNDLPPGKLDIKLQVLDIIIERPYFYQSTTPVLKEMIPSITGYLDTLIIRGNFFKQPNSSAEIFIDQVKHKIIKETDEEIKVFLDTRIFTSNPVVEVKIGEFIVSENITMLPPQILKLDKDIYHFYDEITVQTKYYYGDGFKVSIGGLSDEFTRSVVRFDRSTGNITISLKEWFEGPYSFPSGTFFMKDPGILEFKIETDMGEAIASFSIYPPKINKLDKAEYYHGESMEIEGIDFVNGIAGKISIDREFITQGTLVFNNSKAKLYRIPDNLTSGVHSLKIVTAGQESNEIEFTIKSVKATRLITQKGTRKDIFYVEGENLEQAGIIKVNGEVCEIVSRTNTQLGFKLPSDAEFPQFSEVVFEYGPQTFNVGNLEVIEPFEVIYPFQVPADYLYSTSATFTYKNKLHFISQRGTYQFNSDNYTWTQLNIVSPVNLYNYGRKELAVEDEKLYIPYGNVLHIYDFIANSWTNKVLDLEHDGTQMDRVVVQNNFLYTITSNFHDNSIGNKIYRFDLNNNSRIEINYPSNDTRAEIFHCSNGKIVYDSIDGNIYVYNTGLNTWENIGHPKSGTFQYNNNLYFYNNILYYSGGTYATYPQREMYAYDFSTGLWEEKTPMFHPIMNHAVIGSGQYLYLLLGNVFYGNTNNVYLMIYDIAKDLE